MGRTIIDVALVDGGNVGVPIEDSDVFTPRRDVSYLLRLHSFLGSLGERIGSSVYDVEVRRRESFHFVGVIASGFDRVPRIWYQMTPAEVELWERVRDAMPVEDPDWRPSSYFTALNPLFGSRLRKAVPSRKKGARKSKVVRTRKAGRINLYYVPDVKRHWPEDFLGVRPES